MITRFEFLFVIPLLLSSGCLSGLTVKEEPPEGWGGHGGGGGSTGSSGGMAGAGGSCGNGYACIGPVPEGWNGFYRVQFVPYMQTAPPGCADGSEGFTYYAKPSESTNCNCSCAFGGATCSAPTIECFSSPGCQGTIDYSNQADDDMCIVDLPEITGNASCRIAGAPIVTSKGTCTAMNETMPTPPFEEQYNLCPVQFESACGNGAQCMVTDVEPYDVSVCVIGDGSDPCPSGFPLETQVYTSGNDMRACTGCTCDTTPITCSGGSYLVYDGDACTGLSTPVTSAAVCAEVGIYLDAVTGSLKPVRGTPSSGACGTSVSTGSVIPEGPQKICCRKF